MNLYLFLPKKKTCCKTRVQRSHQRGWWWPASLYESGKSWMYCELIGADREWYCSTETERTWSTYWEIDSERKHTRSVNLILPAVCTSGSANIHSAKYCTTRRLQGGVSQSMLSQYNIMILSLNKMLQRDRKPFWRKKSSWMIGTRLFLWFEKLFECMMCTRRQIGSEFSILKVKVKES